MNVPSTSHIDGNPLLKALHQIADLGSCAGRGGLQRAVDIAVSAIGEDDKRRSATDAA